MNGKAALQSAVKRERRKQHGTRTYRASTSRVFHVNHNTSKRRWTRSSLTDVVIHLKRVGLWASLSMVCYLLFRSNTDGFSWSTHFVLKRSQRHLWRATRIHSGKLMDHIKEAEMKYEEWMSCLPEKLWDVPLTNLSIPGEWALSNDKESKKVGKESKN